MIRVIKKAVGQTAVSLSDLLGLDAKNRHSYNLILQAPSGNALAILIGDQSGQHYSLAAGSEKEISLRNTKDLYLLGQNATDEVVILAFYGAI